ncbi:hypothetical protein D5400_06230 [Georhizobium profundi]|uniref:Uncharacterized protein n=2 Tax=Georhizobium profundi TaxID=2341112 RepID=A0A3S9B1W9_9HYPH|nr:hypothetical protein D5400_06230 [Georhizobium profundi]GLQ36910.1 hypothetical protein GCM10007908_05300 [Rhizobium albus]
MLLMTSRSKKRTTETRQAAIRRREQRERQQAYRDEMRDLRRPDRDDIARVWLWKSIRMAEKAEPKHRDWMQCTVLEALKAQGFDERQSEIALDELVERYRQSNKPPFRRKRHLSDMGD